MIEQILGRCRGGCRGAVPQGAAVPAMSISGKKVARHETCSFSDELVLMAAPTLEDVMVGIKNRLATITGLGTAEVFPDTVSLPVAIVGVPDVPSYHATMGRGKMDLAFTVTVLVSSTFNHDGQIALAGYANPTGSSSVVAAIEGDRTLGAVVDDCHVASFRGLTRAEVTAIGYYGGVFTVSVIANGS
jgi:hypothetical protein